MYLKVKVTHFIFSALYGTCDHNPNLHMRMTAFLFIVASIHSSVRYIGLVFLQTVTK